MTLVRKEFRTEWGHTASSGTEAVVTAKVDDCTIINGYAPPNNEANHELAKLVQEVVIAENMEESRTGRSIAVAVWNQDARAYEDMPTYGCLVKVVEGRSSAEKKQGGMGRQRSIGQ